MVTARYVVGLRVASRRKAILLGHAATHRREYPEGGGERPVLTGLPGLYHCGTRPSLIT